MKPLNRIPLERLEEEWVELQAALQRLLAAGPRPGSDEATGQTALQLGLIGHALQADATVVAGHFRLAAASLAQALAQRGAPTADARVNPYQSELWLDVVAAFGREADRARCGDLQGWQLRHPAHAETHTQAAFLALLQRAVAGQPVDVASTRAVLRACEAATASRDDRLGVAPSVRGLEAVARADALQLNEALAQRLAAHQEDALRGDYKRLYEGLVCLPALALVALARRAGMASVVVSGYLPTHLLDLPAP